MLERDGSEGLTPKAATREAPAAWPGLEMASTGVTSMGRSQHPSFTLQTAQPWLAVGQGEAVGLAGAVSHGPQPWLSPWCPWQGQRCHHPAQAQAPGRTGTAPGLLPRVRDAQEKPALVQGMPQEEGSRWLLWVHKGCRL